MTTKTLEEIQANPIKTKDDNLVIQMPSTKLPIGQHNFTLEVTDDSGNTSIPARVMLVVIDTQAPTAVLTVHDEQGVPLVENKVAFGQGFILSAKKSVDLGGGKIASYTWTMVD